MKTVAIHQPQYLPYLGFFHKIANCDIFVLLDDVQFQKNGVQNRNKIKTSQGWQWITVPVQHRLEQKIYEVQIDSNNPWQRKHVNGLVSSYSRAPYFDTYAAELRELLLREWTSLCALNAELMRWVMKALQIPTPILFSSELGVEGNRTELLINICNAVGADCYLSGPGGKLYMDIAAFEASGVSLTWQEYTPPVYEQVFPDAGFFGDLSVVDALFCWGADARNALR